MLTDDFMVRELVGFVISVFMDKSISVLVPFRTKESTYHSDMVTSKILLVHDEREEAEIGDCVLIEAVRKYSKKKNWRLVKMLPLS